MGGLRPRENSVVTCPRRVRYAGRTGGGAAPKGPAVVYTHGGSERQSFPAFHFSPCYAQQYAVNQWLAQRHHYTVLSINYRSGVGCPGSRSRFVRIRS